MTVLQGLLDSTLRADPVFPGLGQFGLGQTQCLVGIGETGFGNAQLVGGIQAFLLGAFNLIKQGLTALVKGGRFAGQFFADNLKIGTALGQFLKPGEGALFAVRP